MKKVLILAYDFPPYVSVGGLRPYSWFRYLKEFGIEPVVVTRQWSDVHGNHLDYISPGTSNEVITEESEFGTLLLSPYVPNLSNRLLLKYGEHKFRLLRKIITGYFEIAQFLFPVGTKSQLYWVAKKYLKTNKVDFIIASGDPFILFKYAKDLSNEFDIPWIADYRDLWSEDVSMKDKKMLKSWNAFLERRIVTSSSFIVAASDFLAHRLEKMFARKQVEVIPNGFDPDAMAQVAEVRQNSEMLSIGFVGSIYNWFPLRNFFEVLSRFISDGQISKVKVNFYGVNYQKEIREMIGTQFKNLEPVVEIFPRMQNADILHRLSSDNVLLLFNNYSIIGTKIYDYIGLNRKILFCYSNDAEAERLKKLHFIDNASGFSEKKQEEMIRKTSSGIIVEDAAHLYAVLKELTAEFDQNRSIQSGAVGAEVYSRKKQVENLAAVIRSFPS